MRIAVVLEPCEEGGFHAWVPALPGCHSEGDTEEGAARNIAEAIALYLETDEDTVPGPPAKRVEVTV